MPRQEGIQYNPNYDIKLSGFIVLLTHATAKPSAENMQYVSERRSITVISQTIALIHIHQRSFHATEANCVSRYIVDFG